VRSDTLPSLGSQAESSAKLKAVQRATAAARIIDTHKGWAGEASCYAYDNIYASPDYCAHAYGRGINQSQGGLKPAVIFPIHTKSDT
jgi:hypothetical protein